MANDYTMKRGDTFEFDLAITRAGVAVDLTGGSLWMTAKKDAVDTDAQAVFQKGNSGGLTGITITGSPFSGNCRVTVAPADTALPKITDNTSLFYDVQLKEASGKVTTVVEGTLTVFVDYTLVS